MPLEKMKVPVNIAQGLDTKTDAKHLTPGRLPTLENARMRSPTRVDKRNGHDSLTMTDLDDNSIDNGEGLLKYRDELLLYEGQKIYSYSEEESKWVSKGRACFTNIETSEVIAKPESAAISTAATVSDYTVVAYTSGSRVYASVYNEQNKNWTVYDERLDNTNDSVYVKAITFNGKIYVFYEVRASNLIRYNVFDPATPNAIGSATTLENDLNTNFFSWDVITVNASYFAVSYTDTTPQNVTKVYDTAISQNGSDYNISLTNGGQPSLSITDNSTIFIVTGDNGGTRTRAAFIEFDGTEDVAPFNIDASNEGNGIVTFSDSNSVNYVYYSIGSGGPETTTKVQVTNAGSVSSSAAFKYGSRVISKPFERTDDAGNVNHYFLMAYSSFSNASPSYYLVRDDGMCVATIAYSNALASILASFRTDPFLYDGKYTYFLGTQINYGYDASGANAFGVNRYDVDFDSEDQMANREFSENLFVAGGQLYEYDGVSFFEHNFNSIPKVRSGSDDSGGSLADGDYSFVFVWEWLDANGNAHRSATSIPYEVTVSGQGGSGEVNLTVQSNQFTEKDDSLGRRNCFLTGFVAIPGSTTYYRFTDSDDMPNDMSSASIAITFSSSSVTSNEILYTTGGVLDNWYPPPSKAVEVYKERLWLAGTDDNEEVWYSKKNLKDEPVEFAAELVLKSPSDGGRDTALKTLDDKLVLFKKDRFYYTFGDGPNDLGQDGSFSDFEAINSDAGAENPHAVVAYPMGVMAKSAKGWNNIDSGFGVSYIGADIEAFNSDKVTSSLVIKDKNEVRFTTTASRVHVFDYVTNTWSTDTGLTSVRAVIWKDQYTLLDTSGNVYVDNASSWEDGATSYSLKLETGWFAFDQIGGFQRIYQMMVRGDYKSKHTLKVEIAYDYNDTYIDEVDIDPFTLVGASAAYRFQVYMKRQKCEAMKFRITETPDKTGTEQSCSLTDFTFLVGRKRGLSKLPTVNTVGADTI